jgi:histidyl-tRNA synthetase
LNIQAPKGTRDFYPEDQRIQNYIFEKWKDVCLQCAYTEYEGPMFEHLELYTGKSGEEIVEQLYNFKDKGGRDLALRPEMTPTLARLVNQKGNALRKPCKWFSIPRLFRYERAQKGRLREFFQLNMDIMGSDNIWSEVDLICSIIRMLKSFGLNSEHFVVGISSRRLLKSLLDQRNINSPASVYLALDKKAKIGEEAFLNLLENAGLNEEDRTFFQNFMRSTNLSEVKSFCQSDSSLFALDELNQLFQALEALGHGDYISLDLNIVRGLAYYTGPIFEVFDRAKSMRAIAGGGRYDDLCSTLGGQKMTGVGFGMGDVVLKDLLSENGLLDDLKTPKTDVFVAAFQFDSLQVFSLCEKLRNMGVRTGSSLEPVKFRKQLEMADTLKSRFVLFVDGEKNDGQFYECKDLSCGEQLFLSLDQIMEIINE